MEQEMRNPLRFKKKKSRKGWAVKRRRMEEALIATERKYQALFEKCSDAIFLSTVEGELIDINPSGVRLFGYDSKKDLLQQHLHAIYRLDPAEQQLHGLMLIAAGRVEALKTNLKRRNGEIRLVEESSSAIRDASGKIIAYLSFVKDVTDLRDLEQRLAILSGYFTLLQTLIPKSEAVQSLFRQIQRVFQKI